MRRTSLKFAILALVLGLPISLAAQQSLGDVARQLRAQREKSGKKPVKVYTNDNIPTHPLSEKPPAAAESASPEASKQPSSAQAAEGQGAEKTATPEDKKKTKEYWQDKFKPLRAQLAAAQEQQQLVEDELNLLQIQLARELDPTAKANLDAKVKAKQNEVDEKRAATEKAKKDLADLEKEFQESGAPEEWSKTE